MKLLEEVNEAPTAEIAAVIGLSPARTRAILFKMDAIEAIGVTDTRRYRLKNSGKAIWDRKS